MENKMTDKKCLEEILLYMNLEQRLQKKIVENYNEIICPELEEREFLEEALLLVDAYFTKKPDETVEPLVRRLKMVIKNRVDIVSGAILAASYYGMEELAMRLPVLEDGVANLYADKKCVEALIGSIMIADGGPAEVAKAIQWYMFLLKNGFNMNECRMARVIGVLAVISSPNVIGAEILKELEQEEQKERKKQKEHKQQEEKIQRENRQDKFFEVVCNYIKQLQAKELEKARRLERTSYRILTGEKNVTAADTDYEEREEISLNGSNFLTGMGEEVTAILTAIHFDL